MDRKLVIMKSNSRFKTVAFALSLMCGTAAHAQKAKENSVVVQVEPQVEVVVKSAPARAAATAAATTTRTKTVVRIAPAVKVATAVQVASQVRVVPGARALVREARPFMTEQAMAADQNVIVTLDALSGSITVRGWDQRQVRVRTNDEKRIELRRKDGTSVNAPATRLQVLFYDSEENGGLAQECGGSSDIKMDVPRGATVILKTQDGDIDVADVAEARASTTSGDVTLRRVARAVEASSMNGDVSLRDAGGHVRLSSVSGSLEAINVSTTDAGDFVQAKTVSGDVTLESLSPARVEARTISGQLNMTGQLAPGGHYEFNTTSGDITLTMPDSASFKLDAQVFTAGEISTMFPLKQAGKSPVAAQENSDHLIGTYGTGDATINLNSFSGTLRLRKK